MTATIRRMSRPRGELTPEQRESIGWKKKGLDQAEQWYRAEVLRALSEGASMRAVSEATGLSTNTIQRWKREAKR